MRSVIETDALIIGAGPAGLWQAFQLGLQGIRAHIVDALPEAGGQCIELYGDKPIYDIPALPVASGRELVERLLAQLRPMQPAFHFGRLVSQLARRDDERFDVTLDDGMRFVARFVFVAAGVGAFVPRRLMLDEARAFEGRGLLYRAGDLSSLPGERFAVLGDGPEAVDAVVSLARREQASIALVHRRDSFKAEAASVARLRELVAAGRVQLVIGQPVGFDAATDDAARLAALRWLDAEGKVHALAVDRVIALLGISPKLGPIAEWGLALERKQVVVDTASFESNVPGLYAIGDINHYPGKRKLILCGFHEATLAAFAAAQRLRPDERIATLYTTTSDVLQQRLGVGRA
ncbi:MAG TPA: NAD(P)/FAD-dependent oxidoreductase [Methylibium sp.]|uniref:NAD(P)/FAD-dependent oxidoreductase n=1 Tax=Methylibium sp. TaxID=2067992 RepID=UPI002DBE02B5|nr:NAD(P)/FAD-dependent oxidoreductase [Methylibium sp.]HEU4459998.1 NAD(P)/FAD-dependent oxidoreductase [Methylibium sp.]